VITSKTVEGWPEYTLDAQKVEMKDIPDLDEMGGIYVRKGAK
jgi:hypothetical protein